MGLGAELHQLTGYLLVSGQELRSIRRVWAAVVIAYAFQGPGLCRAAVHVLASVCVMLQPPLHSVFTVIYSFTLAS